LSEPTTLAPDPFEQPLRLATNDGNLVVDLDGYEGPLDVLLTLAREHKVDLRRISILQLAEQYLAFIAVARRIRLEIAADYLVMAAWLAYLKSRLLLPEPENDGEPTGAELAERLAFQLRRLEAMRQAAAQLLRRNQFGRDLFARGRPEGVRIIRHSVFDCTLFELLKAYGDFRTAKGSADVLPLRMARMRIMSMDEALERLARMIGATPDWSVLLNFLPPGLADSYAERSALASTFAASLELARRGELEMRQLQPFGPIHLRRPGQSRPDENWKTT
jgi:segregation and condensation protein A